MNKLHEFIRFSKKSLYSYSFETVNLNLWTVCCIGKNNIHIYRKKYKIFSIGRDCNKLKSIETDNIHKELKYMYSVHAGFISAAACFSAFYCSPYTNTEKVNFFLHLFVYFFLVMQLYSYEAQ